MTGTSTLRYSEQPSDRRLLGALVMVIATTTPVVAEANQFGTVLVSSSQTPSIMHSKSRRWFDVQLESIRGLEPDWDGYGAEPIDGAVIDRMHSILARNSVMAVEPGSVVPGADGSLQAEWHVNHASFGLLVEETGKVTCWVRPDGQVETEAHGLNALELFDAALARYLR